ncbi:potassium-transporting ATPase subunit KdpA [Acinetobacter haemolyticus]|uniref:Potassium-transporting ATPase potassium-binding subunit n=1 Tax=Acinetobacter haemolyticus CIP 64.3 = MTCC 9819 TaxID=1217659 RepID=N9GJA0_ACIHA|nr:potassium-transporting ATPase subunit KdpA [Acinetobacter haemolyticus]AZN68289.1 potassium-transporting ATPase subunit KdpA [Acinetobacter haemolyticus]ENW17204.1 K+-transporting ATPase, A subunit [Acinetobacter haemolyticus CIP 64.3 = MTCC 9819]EPR88081.1 Potassium-transporting ATPase A chain [Acinetobacter haemolyticus CIP 64.3 = MTCC 9819]NAS02340.1 potassium-transporting ATPase subunit KdpA [Acinetobacter haemolyticus]NAS04303.1 potassium-transporting ATPase subunit KdpA [Acinetobacter
MWEFISVFILAMVFAYPLGRYLADVMQAQPMKSDCIFKWIERPIYVVLGVKQVGMNWRQYLGAFIISNVLLLATSVAILMTQAWLPLNPDHIPNMNWDLALHTSISFLTNTNQQHYSGQAQLSYLSQMTVIVGLQYLSPIMGLALLTAMLRALFLQPSQTENSEKKTWKNINLGNFWMDMIRPLFRFFIPLGLFFSLLLTFQGVPSTLSAGPTVQVLDQAVEVQTQHIPLGPVAPMVAIKQLGSNGGGWYGPNSSVPLENPTPLSNVLEMLAILLIPISVVFMIGRFIQRKKLMWMILGTMLLMSLASTVFTLWAEKSSLVPNIALMEGKEVRFGAEASALWGSLTTQVNNGSVNMMHDSASPLTGLVELSNMLINAIWGGIGCGLLQFFIYLFLAVFIAGLMTGRTPELFGRKIEVTEIKLLALVILLQPVVILGLTAIAIAFPSLTGNSNPASHAISQVFYEYVSAFANNGSGFEGLADNTVWWNLSASVALLAGRYSVLIIPVLIAVSLATKPKADETKGSLQIESPTFALTLIGIVLILTLLQFMPVLVIGPIADYLSVKI